MKTNNSMMQYSDETTIALINELKQIGLEIKEQEKLSDNEFYRAGLQSAKKIVVNHLKSLTVNLIHEAVERVKDS